MTIVGIVGAGVMGAGIAQVALEAGWEVVLHDVDEDAIERATAARSATGSRGGPPGSTSMPTRSTTGSTGGSPSLRHAHILDGLATEAALIVEAALEDLELKRTIFRALDAEAAPDVILASNTSALSITRDRRGGGRPSGARGRAAFLQSRCR